MRDHKKTISQAKIDEAVQLMEQALLILDPSLTITKKRSSGTPAPPPPIEESIFPDWREKDFL